MTAPRSGPVAGRTGCGLCGIDAIGEAIRTPRPVAAGATFTAGAVTRAVEALEAMQPVNAATRAVHAAGFADRDGGLIVVREDVGRHNALDKVIGALARETRTALLAALMITLPLAVIAIPMLDLSLAVIRRTRAGRDPFAPDKKHLHHRLLELGHSHRRAVALMYAWAALVSFTTV